MSPLQTAHDVTPPELAAAAVTAQSALAGVTKRDRWNMGHSFSNWTRADDGRMDGACGLTRVTSLDPLDQCSCAAPRCGRCMYCQFDMRISDDGAGFLQPSVVKLALRSRHNYTYRKRTRIY